MDVRIFLEGLTYQALVEMLLVNTDYKKELGITTMVKATRGTGTPTKYSFPRPLTIQSLMVAMVGAWFTLAHNRCEIGTKCTNPN